MSTHSHTHCLSLNPLLLFTAISIDDFDDFDLIQSDTAGLTPPLYNRHYTL